MILKVLTVLGLTLVFALGLASFVWEDLLIGAFLSTLLVLLYHRHLFPTSGVKPGFLLHVAIRIPVLIGMLVADIVRGTWQVATYVVGIRQLEHPGIVKIPIGNHSETFAGFIGHLVTISPGSFVVDFDWTDRTMLVHYIDASDPEKLRRDVEKYYRLWEYGAPSPERATRDEFGILDEGERIVHEITYYLATIWLTGLLCICVGMVIRTRSGMVRILAFDALTLVLVALLIVYSISTETSYYLDAALMLALLSFISTVVAARYYSERKVF